MTDDEKCIALIASARKHQGDTDGYAAGLRAALMATSPLLNVTADHKKLARYLAHQYIKVLRDRSDVVELCDYHIENLDLSSEFAATLENEAARFECNSGDDEATVKRLERCLQTQDYADYHQKFDKILAYVRNLPPTDS